MDGVRVFTFIFKDRIEFRSRLGNQFVTLKIVEEVLKDYNLQDVVLDGELCIVDKGVENFKKALSSIKKEDGYVKSPRYYLFDMLTLDEFYSGKSERTLS